MVTCNGKDKIGKQVLNNRWVSIPHGSEHFSFKSKNNYEDDLYKIEDQRYYYDQTIKTNEDILRILFKAEEEIQKLPEGEEYVLDPKVFSRF